MRAPLATIAVALAASCVVSEPSEPSVASQRSTLQSSVEYPIDGPKSVPSAGAVGEPAMVYQGAAHVVVWRDDRDAPWGRAILGRVLNRDGSPSSAGMYLVATRVDDLEAPVLVSAWGNLHLALARATPSGRGAFGTTLDSSFFEAGLGHIDAGFDQPIVQSMSSTDDTLLVTWFDQTTRVIGYSIATQDGGTIERGRALTDAGQFSPESTSTAWDGGYLVAWTESAPSRLFATRVTAAGVPLDLGTAPPLVNDLKGLSLPSAAPMPPLWAVACAEDESLAELARGVRLDSNGVLLDVPAVTLFSDPLDAVTPVLVPTSNDAVQMAALTSAGLVSRLFLADGGASSTALLVPRGTATFTELVGASHPQGACFAWVVDGGAIQGACGLPPGPVVQNPLSYATNEQRMPAVASWDTVWVTVFGDNRNGKYEARLARLLPDAGPIGFTQPVFAGRDGQQVQYAVAAINDEVMIAVTEVGVDGGNTIATRWARRDSTGINPSGGAPLDTSGQESALVRLTRFGNSIAGTWIRVATDGGNEVVASIWPPQGPWGPQRVIAGGGNFFDTAIACGPNQCLVVWARTAPNEIEGVRFDTNGQPIDAAPIDLGMGNNGRHQPSVAYGSGSFQVVWIDQAGGSDDLVARQMFADGGLDATGQTVSQANSGGIRRNMQPTLAWDGKAFVAVYTVEPNEGTADLYLSRLSPIGAVLGTRQPFSARRENERNAASASNAAGRTMVVYERLVIQPNEASIRLRARFHADISKGFFCLADGECETGFCVEGVCCDSRCPMAGPGGCETCLAARGASDDGSCGPVTAGLVCRAAADSCDFVETCSAGSSSCPADLRDDDAGCVVVPTCDGGSCDGGTGGGGGAGGGGGSAGGAGGGNPFDPRVFTVGCGCGSGVGPLALLALVLLRRRSRQSSARRCGG